MRLFCTTQEVYGSRDVVIDCVVLRLDGQPTIGETDPERILKATRERRKDNVRVFSLGIGAIAGVFMTRGTPWQFLHDYQYRRIDTFLDPAADPLGAGYNIIQAKIALGSGGWSGKGFMQGTQSRLNFLPEQHTYFIYAVVGEELGLTSERKDPEYQELVAKTRANIAGFNAANAAFPQRQVHAIPNPPCSTAIRHVSSNSFCRSRMRTIAELMPLSTA